MPAGSGAEVEQRDHDDPVGPPVRRARRGHDGKRRGRTPHAPGDRQQAAGRGIDDLGARGEPYLDADPLVVADHDRVELGARALLVRVDGAADGLRVDRQVTEDEALEVLPERLGVGDQGRR